MTSFCVVIPMYNEEAGAEKCIRAVCATLAELPYQSAVVAVNDGSIDGTGDCLERLKSEFSNLMVLRHESNHGYGAALRTGVRKAVELGLEYALFMDSDLTNDPGDIARFAERMEEGFDVIKATRYGRGGKVIGVPAYRVWISRWGNAAARGLFGIPISDCTNGFRAVRVSLLSRMTLREPRFAVIMEELYWSKFLARRFAEVPVTLTSRARDARPTSFTYSPAVFWKYLKYALKSGLGIQP